MSPEIGREETVPPADSALNKLLKHVIGNKSDAASKTAGQASVIARLRYIIDSLLEDGTIGLANIESLVDDLESRLTAARAANLDNLDAAISNIVNKDSAPVVKVYPAGADGIAVESTTSDWGYGSWVEIIPEDTVTETFWIIGVTMMGVNISTQFNLDIGTGASGSESVIATLGSYYGAAYAPYSLATPIKVAANTRIAMRLATKGTVAKTLTMAVQYVTGL
ncbi:MAG: hypothetical protein ACE5OO_00400 [Candidatus Bathyarchaeia archaeon]